MTTTTTDYTGRLVDLFISQGLSPTGMKPITLDFDSTGQIITGIQKAIQTFLIVFLTEKGSNLADPNFGTRFITNVRNSNLRGPQLQIHFRDAVEDFLNQQSRYIDGLPDDEILDEIILDSYNIQSKDSIELNVRINSKAGESQILTLPISLVIK